MNKQEFVVAVTEKVNGSVKKELTKKEVEAVVNAYHEVVKETLANKEKVQFVGFGTYETSYRKEREGKNPLNGEKLVIAGGYVPRLKFGKAIKEAVK